MASGKQHAAASSIVGSAMILPAILFFPNALWISFGCFLGILLTPDLDVKNPVYSHYAVGKIGGYAGSVIEFISKWTWRLFWYPYSAIIPRHRHWSSHFPIVGTIGRLAYISVFVVIVTAFYPFVLDYLYNYIVLMIVVGLTISDTIHWIMDGFPIYL